MSRVSVPFADFARVSLPLEALEGDDFRPGVEAELRDVFGEAGAYESAPGQLRLGSTGLVRFDRAFGVGVVSISGGALAVLREKRLLESMLWCFQLYEHRVTQIHVTLDTAEDAPNVLRRLHRRAVRGELRLTRKAIPRAHVMYQRRSSHYDGRGTGTLYLGKRKRDVWAKIYDNRNKLIDHALADSLAADEASTILLNDIGPSTRYEISIGRHVGASLRDIALPESLFWHYAAPLLLDRPPGVLEWVPGEGGFEVERAPSNPARQLELLIETSPDIKRAVALADRLGPQGRAFLLTRLQKQFPGARFQRPSDGKAPVLAEAS